MKKYTGLTLLVALVATSLLAVKAAPDDKQPDRKGNGVSEAQISQLDKRLSERITEQQDLLVMVEKLLDKDLQQKIQHSAQTRNVLSGRDKPPASVVPTVVAKIMPKAPERLWWQDLKPEMVYLSGEERYAVINGKMYTNGQGLDKDIAIQSIKDDSVVLRFKDQHHTYFLKK